MKKPNVYIIAGPNGSGKTTFATQYLPEFVYCPEFINADLLAQELCPEAPDRVAIQAGRTMLERIESLTSKNIDFGFETTLSGKMFARLISRLRSKGYSIHLFFLWLPNAEFALDRVAERVERGGHNIPEVTVRRRYKQGLQNFVKKYGSQVDEWILFNNSRGKPQVIARSKDKKIVVFDQLLYNAITFEGSQ